MKEINRKNSNDRRWNLKYLKEKYGSDESFIASQLTDLDFPTPNFIFRQIIRRCRFKSLSYIVLDDEYYQSIIKWYKIRKNVELKQEWINYCYGELLGIVAIIRQISHVGAKFVITSPVRSALPKICTFNYREVIFNELQIKNNKFEFDFNALNEQLRDPMVKAFLLCNPMNPRGKLWTVEELTKIANICYQNNVILISDESGGGFIN